MIIGKYDLKLKIKICNKVVIIFLFFRFESQVEAKAETEAEVEEAYESAPEYKTEIKIQITLSEDGIKIRIKLMIGKQSLISNFLRMVL